MSKSDDSSRRSLLALKGAGPLGCGICHIQFPTPEERIQHARDKHKVHKSKFPCTACNLTGFSSSFGLQYHIQGKCLGVGWEARLTSNSDADLSSSALNDAKDLVLSEEPLKYSQSKSSSIDSTEVKALKQIGRPSLRSSKLEKPENCGASGEEIGEALVLTPIDESVNFSGSLPPRKRRMSGSVEQPVKIPRKKLKSVGNVPTDKGDQLDTIVTESTQNEKTAARRTRQNSSVDTKPYASKLTKSRKTSSLLHETPAKDTTDKISNQVSRTEPEKFDFDHEYIQAKVEASNLTHINETPESKSSGKTLPFRKRRISAKSSKKELKSEEADDIASKEESEYAIKSAPPEIMSAVPGENLESVSVSVTGNIKKTRANNSSKIESGFASLTSRKLQNYKKFPNHVQESGKEPILDSIITTHDSESPLDDIFSSRRRRVLTKIPKKNSKFIESALFDYGERNRKHEQESESYLMASESINGNDDNQDQASASGHLCPKVQTRSSNSSVVSSGVAEVTKEKLKKSRILTAKSVVPSDQKGILSLNNVSVVDNGAKSLNKLLSTSQDEPSIDVKKCPSHFRSTISNSEKTVKKSRLWKIRSGKDDPSTISVKKSHSPYAHKSLVYAASLKTKKLTGFFKDSIQKGYKQKYSLDSAGASCKSLCSDNTIPKNAIGDCHLEIIVEEKSVSQNSSKESKSKSVFREPLELLRQADSKMVVSCDQMHDSLKPSKEPQQSKAEDISKVTGESFETPIVNKDMGSASALASTSDFRKRMNLKMSAKRSKGIVKTLNVKTFTTSSKAEETTALEPEDTSLDAKRLELKRLRESLGLDFSHTPRSTTSSVSSNASGSSALGSPQTPKATFGGLNLLKSSRSTSNPSTQLSIIMPKPAEKFALLDWDSFISKASNKSRTLTKIRKVVSPKTPIVSNVAEKSATGSLSEEADDSLENTEKTTVSITPESPLKPSMETNSRLQDCGAKLSKSDNFSAVSDSPLISEKPSPTSRANTPENFKSDIQRKNPKSTKVSAEDISEMSTSSRVPEHAEETKMEVESNLAIQNREIAGSSLDYKLQELDDSHDAAKNDDENSVSTVPCYGESLASDSDRESDQNEKMSMLSCPVCHLGGFATKAELKVHLTISCREEEPQKKKVIKKRKRPIEWYCPGCPRSFGPFESAKALLDHLPTCHIKRAAFFNGESKTGKGKGRNFQIDPKDLPFWPAPLPSTPVTYGCPVCGCFFATASRLDQHRSEADHFHVVGRFLKTNGHFKSSK
nr:Zinc finger C2H2 [Hymenolepis microstoma]